jgi:uncharacterized RDD family membrane protein YckC
MYWYYADEDIEIGPLTETEFESLVNIGKVTDSTRVWHEGMADWQPYGRVRAAAAPAPVPASTPVPMPSPAFIQSATAIPAGLRCSECRNEFPADELIRYQNSWICNNCKPIFFQRLREGVSAPGTLNYAGFWIRFGAKMIDFVILWVVEMVFLLALSPAFGFRFLNPSPQPNFRFLIAYPFLMAFSFGYSVYFVGKYGATPGKMALGLKIISSTGQPVTYMKALGRMFAEMLSGIICYVGYIMVAFNDEKKALHDQICDTRVIRK